MTLMLAGSLPRRIWFSALRFWTWRASWRLVDRAISSNRDWKSASMAGILASCENTGGQRFLQRPRGRLSVGPIFICRTALTSQVAPRSITLDEVDDETAKQAAGLRPAGVGGVVPGWLCVLLFIGCSFRRAW